MTTARKKGETSGPAQVTERPKKIWICKTNIATRKDLKKIEFRLNEHPDILKWSIDRHDHDNVLRVISQVMELAQLIAMVGEAGYTCEELPD